MSSNTQYMCKILKGCTNYFTKSKNFNKCKPCECVKKCKFHYNISEFEKKYNNNLYKNYMYDYNYELNTFVFNYKK